MKPGTLRLRTSLALQIFPFWHVEQAGGNREPGADASYAIHDSKQQFFTNRHELIQIAGQDMAINLYIEHSLPEPDKADSENVRIHIGMVVEQSPDFRQ